MVAAYDSANKRIHLVQAAKELFYQQGFHKTTLADVAERAQVPLGNVNYYFTTKQTLAEAVFFSHEDDLREKFAHWETTEIDPRLRLKYLVRAPLDSAELIVRFGCPHGTLCQELEKLNKDSPLVAAGTHLMTVYIEWAQQQFRMSGYEEGESRELAEQLVAAVQGTMLLAHTLRSREVLEKQLIRVESWLGKEMETRKRKRS
jgi:AcrR family transcriptional regulator